MGHRVASSELDEAQRHAFGIDPEVRASFAIGRDDALLLVDEQRDDRRLFEQVIEGAPRGDFGRETRLRPAPAIPDHGAGEYMSPSDSKWAHARRPLERTDPGVCTTSFGVCLIDPR